RSRDPRHLPSFPTRRSSDLFRDLEPDEFESVARLFHERGFSKSQVIFTEEETGEYMYVVRSGRVKVSRWLPSGRELILAFHGARSEEHTSELQSRENLVCRL